MEVRCVGGWGCLVAGVMVPVTIGLDHRMTTTSSSDLKRSGNLVVKSLC